MLYKIEWFIEFSATNKIDNLTCVIIHDNILSILLVLEKQNVDGKTIYSTHNYRFSRFACCVCMVVGRISVTQGRDGNAPIMTQ